MVNKYNAKHVRDDGILFDSKKEHKRYCELKLLKAAKKIAGLDVHPKFNLKVNDKLVCVYEADFVYLDLETQKLVYEDVKGFSNAVFKLKHKLFSALHPDIDLRVLATR